MPNYECRTVPLEKTDMSTPLMENRELLGRLIGPKEAAREYRGCLSELFGRAEIGQSRKLQKLRAARELVQRLLREELSARSVLASPHAVRDYLRLLLSGKEHEIFAVLFLDAQNRLIIAEELFRGTLTQTSVYPREVVKHALMHNAAAAILAHNHPSGVAEPSIQDQALTRTLQEALALVDVKVLDHFVIAGSSALSFAERGLI
jgi:DNA repair protein RadC